MPDWMREVLLALSAFIGGRAVNALGESVKRGQALQRSVDRLTMAVEHIGNDLQGIRGEIHDQVGGLKLELHDHKREQENRLLGIEDRVDGLGGRIDALAQGAGWNVGGKPPSRRMMDFERRCFKVPGDEETEP